MGVRMGLDLEGGLEFGCLGREDLALNGYTGTLVG